MNRLILALISFSGISAAYATDCHLNTERASGQISSGQSIPLTRAYPLTNGQSLYGSDEIVIAPRKTCRIFTLSELPQGKQVALTDQTVWTQNTSVSGYGPEFEQQIDRQFAPKVSALIGHFARAVRPELKQFIQFFEDSKSHIVIGLHCVSDNGFNSQFVEQLSQRSGFNVCAPTLIRLSPTPVDAGVSTSR